MITGPYNKNFKEEDENSNFLYYSTEDVDYFYNTRNKEKIKLKKLLQYNDPELIDIFNSVLITNHSGIIRSGIATGYFNEFIPFFDFPDKHSRKPELTFPEKIVECVSSCSEFLQEKFHSFISPTSYKKPVASNPVYYIRCSGVSYDY